MKQLRVLQTFRDERNFFTLHQEGDIIEVFSPERVTRLIEGGLCELVDKDTKVESSDTTKLESPVSPAEEKPVEQVVEQPKEALVVETRQPVKRRKYDQSRSTKSRG